MAYGTKTIQAVDKLVGPGNQYVLAAKMLVSNDLPIDVPAGPSEVIVLADQSADPTVVALDMVSQAEHLDGFSVLVTDSWELAKAVVNVLNDIDSSLPNKDSVVRNLSKKSFILVCKDMKEAIRFVNEFSPEHLEVMADNAWKITEEVKSAGLVLIGRWTPVAASDYCLGTIHILPTQGFSKVYSGLSILNFVRRYSVAECSREELKNIKKYVQDLANIEGLKNHSLALEGRF
jgi:histidinol dehydrogenase